MTHQMLQDGQTRTIPSDRGAERTGLAPKRRRSKVAVAAVLSGALMTGGCSTVVAGAMTLGDVSNVAGMVSTLVTGKGIPEHLISYMTGKDCRFTEGLFRKDRKICEDMDSPARDKDFKGVIVMLFPPDPNIPTPSTMYAQNVDPDTLSTLLDANSAPRPSLVRHVRHAGDGRRGPMLPHGEPETVPDIGLTIASVEDDTVKVAQVDADDISLSRTQRRRPDSLEVSQPQEAVLPDDAELIDVRAILTDVQPSMTRTRWRRGRNWVIAEAQGRGPHASLLTRKIGTVTDGTGERSALYAGDLLAGAWSPEGRDEPGATVLASSGPQAADKPQVEYTQGNQAVRISFAVDAD